MPNELALVERAQKGDKSALAEIVESHQQTIYNVALRMCGNPQDAEETLQETFLSAIKALPKFEGRSQLSTWLYRIASNACLMQRRRAASGAEVLAVDLSEDDEAFDLPKYFVDWTYKPDDILLDNELREVMQDGLFTRRTVPSGGSRHPFETYLVINRVEGLPEGVYRYLPLDHQLCFIETLEAPISRVKDERYKKDYQAQINVVGIPGARSAGRHCLGLRRTQRRPGTYASDGASYPQKHQGDIPGSRIARSPGAIEQHFVYPAQF